MASPLSSSTGAAGWSRIAAARWITVSAPRSAPRTHARVGEIDEVAEDHSDLDPEPAEPTRVADQDAHVLAALEQLRQQRAAHRPRRPGDQNHARTLECRLGSGPRRGRGRTGPTSETEGTKALAYVIAEPCIGQKDNSCVEVCPVDCIHPTPDEPDYDNVEQLFIDPDECIDCDACVEACPVDACFAEDQLPEEWAKYTPINAEYFAGK